MPLVEAKPRISLKNILFPTDFSERSAAALPYAAAIARHYDAKIYLAHVVISEEAGSSLTAVPPASNWSIAQQEMALLDRCDLLNGLPYEALVEEGELWDVLSRMIKDRDIDFIVLGTSGGGGFKKLIVGSVADEIMREASCPVLAVGPEVPSRTQLQGDMRCILYAADLQPWSDLALTYAVSLAEENHAQLTMVHALYPDKTPPANRDWGKFLRELQRMLPSDANLAPQPEFVVEIGAPVEIILKVAADKECDLIVMGAREMCYGRPSAPFAWVMLHQILCAAQCPVLIVHG
jgi:nucleotide-binding universal stress UspA family protein